MKKVLVTTDFSTQSRRTLEGVLHFFKDSQEDCQIILLNTYLVTLTDPDFIISLNDEMKLKSKNGLEKEKAAALKINSNKKISIETTSHIGSLNNVIQRLIRCERIDMVALGKEDREALEELRLALKDHDTCSLLVTQEDHFKGNES
jgi:hypothetical protein